MGASRLIPLIPVWEVQEGQMAHELKQFGRETVVAVSELE
jgi:molybdopterin-containing oxidoreductase family membrane subunit